MRGRTIAAALLTMAPVGAQSADLVVWWEKGFYEQENEAVREIVAAFEHETGKRVELVMPEQDELPEMAEAAVETGHPPGFLWGTTSETWLPRWAYDDRLTELTSALEPVLSLFDEDAIAAATLLNGKTGERGLYGMPMGRSSNHLHMWNNLLEQAGFNERDIPEEWDAFWSFWCDEAQPALREALGRDDVWGVGLPMSLSIDTRDQLGQFQAAHSASWLGPDGRPRLTDPQVRAGMVRALNDYTEIWRKGCTPPDAVDWTNYGNNKAFLDQTVLVTPNVTLSIPGALRDGRPEDYYENARTIAWPNAVSGEMLVLHGTIARAAVFQGSDEAPEFARFLAEGGWLAHWLSFAGDRLLPPMRKLLEQPFWLDTSDPHRLRAAVQALSQPHQNIYNVRGYELRSEAVFRDNVWGKAAHRVVADGLSAEEAVDEAIARINEILSE
jgi:multiple sugar transport system substrate-binding protein